MKLSGKVILITGGSKGLGYELTKLLLHKNAIVWSISRTPANIYHDNFNEILYDLELLTKNQVPNTIKCLLHMQFDILINNVGYNPGHTLFKNTSILNINTCLAINIYTHIFFTRHIKFKKVIFVGSILGVVTLQENIMYCASKHFLNSFHEGLRREGIDTYIIYPGKINTDLFHEMQDFLCSDKQDIGCKIIQDIKNNRTYRYVPAIFRLLPIFTAIIPTFIVDYVLQYFYSKYGKKKH